METPQINTTVSVLIPNYNGKSLLERYLPLTLAVCQQSRTIEQFEVIVSDDASSDDSVAFVQAHYPMVRVVQSAVNRGFAATVNQALAMARYQYVLLLNNDIELQSNFFDSLLPLLSEQTFGISCPTLNPTTGTMQEGRKQLVLKSHKVHYVDDKAAYDVAPTIYLCGGNALIDRQKMVDLGGLDEIYSPFYFEDMDLSLRAWLRGWTCLYSTQTACVHQHSATIGKLYDQQFVEQIFKRNSLLLHYRFLPSSRLWAFWGNFLYHWLKETFSRRAYRPYRLAWQIIRSEQCPQRYPINRTAVQKINQL